MVDVMIVHVREKRIRENNIPHGRADPRDLQRVQEWCPRRRPPPPASLCTATWRALMLCCAMISPRPMQLTNDTRH